MTENEFINEKQKILKSMSDTICLAREEAECILEEIEQYRAIGTVEECRAAVERQKTIKPKFEMNFGDFTSRFSCECGKKIVIRHDRGVMDNHDGSNFCYYCGRAFEWS